MVVFFFWSSFYSLSFYFSNSQLSALVKCHLANPAREAGAAGTGAGAAAHTHRAAPSASPHLQQRALLSHPSIAFSLTSLLSTERACLSLPALPLPCHLCFTLGPGPCCLSQLRAGPCPGPGPRALAQRDAGASSEPAPRRAGSLCLLPFSRLIGEVPSLPHRDAGASTGCALPPALQQARC